MYTFRRWIIAPLMLHLLIVRTSVSLGRCVPVLNSVLPARRRNLSVLMSSWKVFRKSNWLHFVETLSLDTHYVAGSEVFYVSAGLSSVGIITCRDTYTFSPEPGCILLNLWTVSCRKWRLVFVGWSPLHTSVPLRALGTWAWWFGEANCRGLAVVFDLNRYVTYETLMCILKFSFIEVCKWRWSCSTCTARSTLQRRILLFGVPVCYVIRKTPAFTSHTFPRAHNALTQHHKLWRWSLRHLCRLRNNV